jgi:hypothetical protein
MSSKHRREILPFLAHTSDSSKLLSKLVIVLFIALQMVVGFMFSNFYNDFKGLEAQVDTLDHNVEELMIELKLLMNPREMPAAWETL